MGEEKLVKIGDAIRQLGVDRTTLWRYEEKGLVKTLRNHAGVRFYKQEDLDQLRERITPKQITDLKEQIKDGKQGRQR